jgi:hypothetical protein
MKQRKLMTAIAVGACAVPAAALANDADVRNAGSCDGASSAKIKVKPDDGRIEVEFEVDQNKNGRAWGVKFRDNGELVFRGNATTKAPSGSFSIDRRIDDMAGADKIVATGVDKSSGERCRAKVTI